MKVLVLGATGKVGRLVVNEALRRGHEVTAFVHSSSLPEQPGLQLARGDVYNAASIEAAIEGCDTVICALSSWGTPRKDVLSTAMRVLVPTMQAREIDRLVTLTGNLALLPHEQIPLYLRLVHRMLGVIAPKVARDAEDHLALLRASKLDWTSLRSPVMTNHGRPTYRLINRASFLGTISRRAVAYCLVDLAERNDWLQQAPTIHPAK